MKINEDFYKDIAVIYLAVGLIDLSEQVEKGEFESEVLVGGNSLSDVEINVRTKLLKQKMVNIIKKCSKFESKVKPLREALLLKAIEMAKDSIQLDYLAMYILRFRFKPLKGREMANMFKEIAKYDIISIMELLDKTLIAGRDEEMCEMAFDVLN